MSSDTLSLMEATASLSLPSNSSSVSSGQPLALTMPSLHHTTHNLSSSTTPLPPTVHDFVFYSEAVVQPFILCLGLIFNIINLLVLWKAQIAAMFRLCLLALTLSDSLVCVFGIAQLLVEGIAFRGEIPFGYWHGAALASHILYYVFLTLICNSSIYVIVAASVRARMIAHPYKIIDHTKLKNIKYTLIVTFLVTVTFFLPCPIYAVWQVCYKETDHEICQEFFRRLPHVDTMQYYFYVLSLFFGPVLIVANVVCFVVIKAALRRSTRRMDQLKKDSRRRHQYHRITHMLLIILMLDTCWILPSIVQYLGLVLSTQNTIFNKQNVTYVIYDVIAEILLLFRPTYNIFVYLATNREYRLQFTLLFCRHYKRSQAGLTSMESYYSSPSQTPHRQSKVSHQAGGEQGGETEDCEKSNGGLHKPSQNAKPHTLLEDLNSVDSGQSVQDTQADLQDVYVLTEHSNSPSEAEDRTTNGSNM